MNPRLSPPPLTGPAATPDRTPHGGLSLRDYFAAHALAGLLAYSPPLSRSQYDPASVAVDAYSFADAMLAAKRVAGNGVGEVKP